jgi:UDP-N-acetylmuramoyl-L-alanyl-D-glutamate--2,6-diaminopimelate ligase
MKLSELVKDIAVSEIVGEREVEVTDIAYDSRKVKKGSLFVAMKGAQFDGHRFIVDAIGSGASAVAVEDNGIVKDEYFLSHHTTKLLVPSTRRALALLSAAFFEWPAKKLKIIGVTGTNGKTTSTYLLEWTLRSAGEKALLVGTIKYMLNGETIESARNTTPESFELQRMMAAAVAKKASFAVMEVSSHSLVMDRVFGIPFKAAVFTNLTQDHLDFHKTMEEYFKSKKILFDSLTSDSVAVVNVDDEYSARILSGTSARKVSYGFAAHADFRITEFSFGMNGTQIVIRHKSQDFPIHSMLVGKFNAYNLAGVFATLVSLGYDPHFTADALSKAPSVKGRFERIDSGKGYMIVIDYSGTPDSLQKALQSAREILTSEGKGGRLLTLFGCGGNRDRTKRPKMGKIARDLSDIVIVASDNPRFENPEEIADEIFAGIGPHATSVFRILDRSEAIKKAVALARPNDIVILAGKGHENYQDVKGLKYHFDEREEVEKALENPPLEKS